MTLVVNKRYEPYDVYIGRGSPFGNPFPIDHIHSREWVIARYREYFYDRLGRDEKFLEAVLKLEGRRLGCHCKPLPCHGDVIVEFLEQVKSGGR